MKDLLTGIKIFFVYVGAYLLIVNYLHIYNLAYSMCYVGALLLLPIQSNSVRTMVYAFILGLTIDIFSNTPGMHAASCVLLSFVRTGLLELLKPGGNYEEYMEISIPSMGLKWYLNFMLPSLFMHHFLFFMIDYASFSKFWLALLKAVLSSIFTLLTIILIQYILNGRRRSNLI